jgi:integrase
MATVSKRRGKWVCDWRDATGRRRWKTFERKKDAEAYRDEASRQKRQGIVSDERLTLDELAKRYHTAHIATNVRATTAADYESQLRLYIVPQFQGWKVHSIQRQDVIDFRAKLVGEGVGRRTVNKCLRLLGGLFRYAMLNGWAHRNPATLTALPTRDPDKHVDDEINVLGIDEQRRLVAAADARWRLVILTALCTGMRVGELLGLQWDDVDLASGVIQVRRQFTHGQLAPLKSRAARRTIPIPGVLVHELKAWKLACPKGEYGLVFPNGAGNHENASNVLNRGLRPTLRRAGLRRIRFHDLRHCYASTLIGSGVQNIKRLQQLLGHTSAKMTLDIYGHLLPDEEDLVAGKVGAALFGGSKVVAAPKRKGLQDTRNPLSYLAPRAGLEPATNGLTVRRSTN